MQSVKMRRQVSKPSLIKALNAYKPPNKHTKQPLKQTKQKEIKQWKTNRGKTVAVAGHHLQQEISSLTTQTTQHQCTMF